MFEHIDVVSLLPSWTRIGFAPSKARFKKMKTLIFGASERDM